MNFIVSHVDYVSPLYVDPRQQGISVQNEAYDTVNISTHWMYLSTNICLVIIIMWESDYDRLF